MGGGGRVIRLQQHSTYDAKSHGGCDYILLEDFPLLTGYKHRKIAFNLGEHFIVHLPSVVPEVSDWSLRSANRTHSSNTLRSAGRANLVNNMSSMPL